MARLTSMDKEVLYAQPGGRNCKVTQKRLWVYNSNGGCKKNENQQSNLHTQIKTGRAETQTQSDQVLKPILLTFMLHANI